MTAHASLPRRVLIVDDDEEMRLLVMEHFTRSGWVVSGAVDGVDLLAKLLPISGQAKQIDLVICDERMPRLGGLEALRALTDQRVTCPFILLTGFGDGTLHATAERLGARMTLDKPIDLDVLVELAAAVVDDDSASYVHRQDP